MPEVTIERIFVAPEHSFVGQRRGRPRRVPMRPLASVECAAGRGLRGDRYFDFKQDYKGQVTFFGAEVFRAVCAHVGARECPPWAMRRNVMLAGIDLNTLVGRVFELQGVRFAGIEECSPCHWMDHAIGPGAQDFLKGRGGLRARILDSGTLSCGPARLVVQAASRTP